VTVVCDRLRVPVALGWLVLLLVLNACDAGTPGGSQTPAPSSPATAGPALQAQLVASQLTVGAHRFPFGLLERKTPITEARVHVRAYVAAPGGVAFKGESDAPFKGDGLEGRGLYIAQLNLDVAGAWLAVVTAERPGTTASTMQLPFRVAPTAVVPMVGQPAPRSHNQTIRDVPDVSYIDSGVPADDMHVVSIADAIEQHRPTLVVFATPAFCSSATCGPQVHAVQQLEPAYRDRLTFIHVEIYRDFRPDPAKRQFTQTVVEWHLQTEPWVFLIDGNGIIRAEFEGTAATDELKQAADQLLAA
jgi:hypothetical protein